MNQRFPFPPFLNGWFRVGYSDELPHKKVIPLRYFGQDLVLFRTEDGTPYVFDAHCPHLGAHLGHGGRVEGDNIRCPFHGWAFNPQGNCVNISYTCKIPQNAHLRSWPVCEVNGLIMVYHHTQGKPPTWQMSNFPRWNEKEWTGFKRHSWKIRSRIQDMAENAIDSAHFPRLHGKVFRDIKDTTPELDGPIFMYRSFPKYKQSIIGKLVIEADGIQEVIYHGLGCVCTYTSVDYVKSFIKINTLFVFMYTPIDEEYVELHILCSIKKLFNQVATLAVHRMSLAEGIKAIEQDITIWENKVQHSHPLVCEGDGPIMQYRNWAGQFYLE